MQIIECDQGSEAWIAARMGIPTASEFATVMAKGRSGGDSKTRATYMRKLAGEILTGKPMEHFGNVHTDRGHEMEPDARNTYSFMRDVEPQLVGFIRNGSKGCSPDSLIGNDGMLEIKTKLPHLQIEVLELQRIPPDHRAQCQGQLWVAEREWIDFVSYWPGLPLLIAREYRDEEYIRQIAEAVEQFNDELGALVERIRALTDPQLEEAA